MVLRNRFNLDIITGYSKQATSERVKNHRKARGIIEREGEGGGDTASQIIRKEKRNGLEQDLQSSTMECNTVMFQNLLIVNNGDLTQRF